jgi:hypothetical protein
MIRLAIALTMLGAAVATGAIGITTASAEEGLLPTNVPLTGTSGKITLMDVNGNALSCASDTILGLEFTTVTKGTFTDIHFKGCKAFSFFNLNTTGDESGVILTGAGTAEACLIDSAKLEFGMFFTLSHTVPIEIPPAKARIELKGSLIGSLFPNAIGKIKMATFRQSKGVATIKSCEKNSAQLLVSLNGGPFVEAAVEAEEALSATNGKTELELMDK